jgi:hypothetical protein
MIRSWIHPKLKFTPEEDRRLCELVEQYGTAEWVFIATHMPRRNSRQCRERWLNYLSPAVNNGSWTWEEEQLLLQKVRECGNAWKLIATFFSSRTDVNIKSHWKVMQRRPGLKRRRQTSPPPPPSNWDGCTGCDPWEVGEIMEFDLFERDSWDNSPAPNL